MTRRVILRAVAALLCLTLLTGAVSAASSIPQASGTYPRWIDRFIKPSPDYATVFYNWLAGNSGADGALADPAKAEMVREGTYGYLLKSYTGTVSFTYNPGGSEADASSAARDAAAAAVKAQYAAEVETVYEYARAVYQAFDHDHPEVFWLTGSTVCAEFYGFQYRYSNGYGSAEYVKRVYFYLRNDEGGFDVRDEKYRDVSAIRSGIARREAAVSEILADSAVAGASTRYEQVRALNGWLTSHNAYNSGADLGAEVIGPDPRSCLAALDGRTGADGPVCEGYARAFKLLCDRLGIPCVLVTGIAYPSGERHMWNCVQMDDGSWYGVDVTWNDPKSSRSLAVSGSETENYLLAGSGTVNSGRTFDASHVLKNDGLDTDFVFSNSPILAAKAYNPADAKPPQEPEPAAPAVGTPMGDVLYTDIVTTIDGVPIRSYNINWNTYIVVEDLLSYGFDVVWSAEARTLTVGTIRTAAPADYRPVCDPGVEGKTGEPAMPYYHTDITAWLGGKQVTSYNIGGCTCISMDDLAAVFAASYVWDNLSRVLRLATVS